MKGGNVGATKTNNIYLLNTQAGQLGLEFFELLDKLVFLLGSKFVGLDLWHGAAMWKRQASTEKGEERERKKGTSPDARSLTRKEKRCRPKFHHLKLHFYVEVYLLKFIY